MKRSIASRAWGMFSWLLLLLIFSLSFLSIPESGTLSGWRAPFSFRGHSLTKVESCMNGEWRKGWKSVPWVANAGLRCSALVQWRIGKIGDTAAAHFARTCKKLGTMRAKTFRHSLQWCTGRLHLNATSSRGYTFCKGAGRAEPIWRNKKRKRDKDTTKIEIDKNL